MWQEHRQERASRVIRHDIDAGDPTAQTGPFDIVVGSRRQRVSTSN
jgi:hypothetical protein